MLTVLQQDSAAGIACYTVSNSRLVHSNAAKSAATSAPSAVSPPQARAAALFGCPQAYLAFYSNRRTPDRSAEQLVMLVNATRNAIISRDWSAVSLLQETALWLRTPQL